MVATLSMTVPAVAAVVPSLKPSMKSRPKLVHIGGLGSFGGLKQQNSISSLGLPACTQQQFARVLSSLRSPSSKKGGGGALSSTCSAASEIFRIAAIMNGLTLVGVAVGFVLLRLEAIVEESD